MWGIFLGRLIGALLIDRTASMLKLHDVSSGFMAQLCAWRRGAHTLSPYLGIHCSVQSVSCIEPGWKGGGRGYFAHSHLDRKDVTLPVSRWLQMQIRWV